MPKREFNKIIDIYKDQEEALFKAKQSEDIRLNLSLFKDNKPYNLNNCQGQFTVLKPNQTKDTIIIRIQNNSNILSVDIPNKLIEEEGIYFGELAINDIDGNIKVPTFIFEIQKSLNVNIILKYILKDKENFILQDIEGFTLNVIS